MRLRNIPRADGVIDAHHTVIKKPEEQKENGTMCLVTKSRFRLKLGWEKDNLF